MTCADCGAAIEPGSELCFECGSPVRRSADASSSYSASVRGKSTSTSTPETAAPAAAPPAGPAPGSYDALIAEALRSVDQPSAPTPAPTPAPAPPLTKPPAPTRAAPSGFAAKRRAAIDEDEKVRCPGCGTPSTKERCPGCGTRLRPSQD